MIRFKDFKIKLNLFYLFFFLLNTQVNTKPILFQIDQVNYIYHGSAQNQNLLERFHFNFLNTFTHITENLGGRKNFPIHVHIYTSPKDFEDNTKLPSISSGLFDPETNAFYFLLTAKTIRTDRLINIISHESCHASIHSTLPYENKIDRVLEEGFCSYEYPTETIMIQENWYCTLSFDKFLEIGNSKLQKSIKKEKTLVYRAATSFIRSIRKTISSIQVIELLQNNNLTILNQYWTEFKNECKNRNK